MFGDGPAATVVDDEELAQPAATSTAIASDTNTSGPGNGAPVLECRDNESRFTLGDSAG
jgi:hypothetical protein